MLAAWSLTTKVRELPVGYNYPLHLHAKVVPAIQEQALKESVHVHYHWLMEAAHAEENPLLRGKRPADCIFRSI